ncbi:MAG: phosphate transport system regulatory protein PhoU [Sulfobacillus thermosulfidooxidans]|uniref:Phosphate-specific transport system accessory protein PhoU n=1 Tax=Sulfobacillus thermotolerans TaxID=338644 RepID=A0ABM6RNU4_9FIRM|nr:phosphate transport system regulatory protein PhoU [Sulfobacillus thermotolerans]MCY0908478.1 phosphate signaling complex protein PhoU [Sulfobacillus thermotolerans]PSR38133.1 MAG: phosphate transport system regulatory protein PhoU [Sulfobacillus thermosulfidooxidans]
MIRQSFHQELMQLEQELIRMGALVEDQLRRAVRSLTERNLVLARQVIAEDDRVDAMEMDIERRCLTLLALQQPLASDLRVVSTALKIITDLERMADHASDIAKVTVRLNQEPLIKPLVDIPEMARLASSMVRLALNAYIHRSIEEAMTMIRLDDDVDHLYASVFRELLEIMRTRPDTVAQGTYLLFVANYIERVADHATNLGEWVIYMVTGQRKELND